MNPQEQKELREAIGKEIDFMCDHWIEGDTKAPYRFGGWRGEIIEDLAELFEKRLSQAIQTHEKSLREKVEGMRLKNLSEQTYGVGDVALRLAAAHPELRNSDKARAGFNICIDKVSRLFSSKEESHE